MLKRFFQAAALFLLGALLVYAPEIFVAVSGPYALTTPERVLLRIVLCTQDADTLSSFYKALPGYQKTHPAVHLRVIRADEQQLTQMSEPLPDVYLFSQDVSLPLQSLFLPLEEAFHVPVETDSDSQAASPHGRQEGMLYALLYNPPSGTPLLCAVSSQAKEKETALGFLSYLHEIPSEAVDGT